MRVRYWADEKSGPVVTKTEALVGGRQVVFGPDKCDRAKRPVSKKTAAELLAADDAKRKAGNREESLLTSVQRETLINRAGEDYAARLGLKEKKPADPFKRQREETDKEYISRLNAHLKASRE